MRGLPTTYHSHKRSPFGCISGVVLELSEPKEKHLLTTIAIVVLSGTVACGFQSLNTYEDAFDLLLVRKKRTEICDTCPTCCKGSDSELSKFSDGLPAYGLCFFDKGISDAPHSVCTKVWLKRFQTASAT